MNFNDINNVYFLGIGGIGMSALARYFSIIGKNVAGYDRSQTSLTDELSSMGIVIHYEENVESIPGDFDNEKTIVVYTPAVPTDNKELVYFRNNGYKLFKRAEILGFITKNKKAVCIAGTHGKTTVTTMTAYLLYHSDISCSAFLGGISKNFNSNFVLSEKSDFVVAEADEFDRSFLKLYPQIAVITSVDADHLDIYNTHEEIISSFENFIAQIQKGGILIIKKGLSIQFHNSDIKIFTYSVDSNSDFHADNIKLEDEKYIFDVITPFGEIKNLTLNHPGFVNVENAVAAIAAATMAGVNFNIIKEKLRGFLGVKRRMDHILKNEKVIYIDDYAHHPREIDATVNSVKKLYPGKKLTGIFQPHLYSRTRDFAGEFAESLSNLDELILLDIYPARELPISGVTSEIIFNEVTCYQKMLIKKEELISVLKKKDIELLITMGAGDIDTYTKPIKNLLLEKYSK